MRRFFCTMGSFQWWRHSSDSSGILPTTDPRTRGDSVCRLPAPCAKSAPRARELPICATFRVVESTGIPKGRLRNGRLFSTFGTILFHCAENLSFHLKKTSMRRSTKTYRSVSQLVTVVCACVLATALTGCATEQSQALQVPTVASAGTAYQGVRSPISVGKFDNRSDFLRGVFSDGVDRLGNQAKTILVSDLQRTGRFRVLDRENLSAIGQEAQFNKKNAQIQGARYVVTGDVTAFGRKVTGDHQLFGILGRGKKQVAYAKVDLNVVDASTSEVVYSTSGAGEYSLSNREIIGFGGSAGYDSTLNGKVLDLAIREAVDRLVEGIQSGAWQPQAN